MDRRSKIASAISLVFAFRVTYVIIYNYFIPSSFNFSAIRTPVCLSGKLNVSKIKACMSQLGLI